MSRADIVLADLEAVRAGPLPLVLPLVGTYERPPLNGQPARLEPPKAVKHDVWVRNVVGIIERFEIFALPHTARDEAIIEARGRYPGMSIDVSVRVAV